MKQPPEMFYKKGTLKIFKNFPGKPLWGRPFFNKVTSLMFATLLKKNLEHKRFPVNFLKTLRIFSLYFKGRNFRGEKL